MVFPDHARPRHGFILLDDGRIPFPARYQFVFDDSHNGGDSETTALVDALDIYDPANGETSRVWDAMKFWDITDPAQRVERQEGVLNRVHINSPCRSRPTAAA